MQKTNIEWADYVWNPVTGCTKVSQGCKNCYAETFHHRFEKTRGKFTDVVCHEDRLDHPLKVKKGGIVFVNSMSDLFHEDVPFEFIQQVYCSMIEANQHTYLVLTKRVSRALEFFSWIRTKSAPRKIWDKIQFPLSNLWIGVSVEDQATADERIPLLLQIPAAVRFLSCEPLLGRLSLLQSKRIYISEKYKSDPDFKAKADRCELTVLKGNDREYIGPDWVICGGESGHKARPMHPDWARSLRDQCAAAGVPFFFKQWGEFLPEGQPVENDFELFARNIRMSADKMNVFHRVGKSKSGHLLDGVEHREFPTQHSTLKI